LKLEKIERKGGSFSMLTNFIRFKTRTWQGPHHTPTALHPRKQGCP
jgi:hypothetical protein